jgi:hypothetical protein
MKINCVHDELLKLSDCKPLERNPNKHSEEQIERLMKLLEYQGQRRPIILDRKDNTVVAGNGTLEAIKRLGWEKIAVNFQDFESDEQRFAFTVSDNAIAKDSWTSLDFSTINQDFLEFGPFDIEMLGIKDFSIEPLEKFDLEDQSKEEKNKKFLLQVELPNESELRDLLDDLISKGYKAKQAN